MNHNTLIVFSSMVKAPVRVCPLLMFMLLCTSSHSLVQVWFILDWNACLHLLLYVVVYMGTVRSRSLIMYVCFSVLLICFCVSVVVYMRYFSLSFTHDMCLFFSCSFVAVSLLCVFVSLALALSLLSLSLSLCLSVCWCFSGHGSHWPCLVILVKGMV